MRASSLLVSFHEGESLSENRGNKTLFSTFKSEAQTCPDVFTCINGSLLIFIITQQ